MNAPLPWNRLSERDLLGLELDEVLIGGAVPAEVEPTHEWDSSQVEMRWAARFGDDWRRARWREPSPPPTPAQIAAREKRKKAEERRAADAERRREWWRRVALIEERLPRGQRMAALNALYEEWSAEG